MHENRRWTDWVDGIIEDVGGISATATSWTSAGLRNLPVIAAPDVALIIVNPNPTPPTVPEKVLVTAHAAGANTATVTRGYDGSTPQAWAQDTPWRHTNDRIDTRSAWKDAVVPVGARFGTPNGIYDDDFNDQALDTVWQRVDRTGNSSSTLWTPGNDVLSCYSTASDNTSELHALVRSMGTLTTPPVTIETGLRAISQYAANYLMVGLIFADGVVFGSGKQIATMPFINTTIAGWTWSFRTFTGFNSNPTDFLDENLGMYNGVLHQRLRWTSANTWEAWWSPDAVSWMRSPDTAEAYTMTPTYMGVYTSHWGNTRRSIASFEYFRVTQS